MKKLYHGSTQVGLKELKPRESTQQGEYVYATPYKELALIFAGRAGRILTSIGKEQINGKNVFSICERKEGLLKKFYSREGYVHELEANNFEFFYEHNWGNTELRATGIQPIIKSNQIKNMYEELLKYEKAGKIKLYHYPERPKRIPLNNIDLVQDAFKMYLMAGRKKERLTDFTRNYPEFKKIVEKILNKISKFNDEELKEFINNLYDYDKQNLKYELI